MRLTYPVRSLNSSLSLPQFPCRHYAPPQTPPGGSKHPAGAKHTARAGPELRTARLSVVEAGALPAAPRLVGKRPSSSVLASPGPCCGVQGRGGSASPPSLSQARCPPLLAPCPPAPAHIWISFRFLLNQPHPSSSLGLLAALTHAALRQRGEGTVVPGAPPCPPYHQGGQLGGDLPPPRPCRGMLGPGRVQAWGSPCSPWAQLGCEPASLGWGGPTTASQADPEAGGWGVGSKQTVPTWARQREARGWAWNARLECYRPGRGCPAPRFHVRRARPDGREARTCAWETRLCWPDTWIPGARVLVKAWGGGQSTHV